MSPQNVGDAKPEETPVGQRKEEGATPAAPRRADPSAVRDAYDTYIFDADGVLWLGARPVAGAAELVAQLQAAGKRVVILTNNATRSPRDTVTKCHRLGFTGITDENVVTAGLVTAHELRKLRDAASPDAARLPVYVFGSAGLCAVLTEHAGVQCIGSGPDRYENYSNETFLMDIDTSQRVFAVVAGFDPHMSYIKVMKAVNYLKDPAVHFIVTNEDLTFPGSNPDVVVPGAGTVSTVLRAISGRTPMVMGKPDVAPFRFICERFGNGAVEARRTLMVGDRCDTDVAFGRRNGVDTLLVLTGVHQPTDVDAYRRNRRADLVPTMYTDSVKDLCL